MIESQNVRFNLYPSCELTKDVRDFVYNRGEFNTLNEEEKIEQLIDWLVTHGNRCFEVGKLHS